MARTFKKAFIILLFILLLSPTLLLADEDDLYDRPGFDPNRETFGIGDFEHIDPFTGGLTLNFEDVRIPGNGGLDLVAQRTYNSKNACKAWVDVAGTVTCSDQGEDSWVGLGWTLHFGKLLAKINLALPHIIEMPDGSRHEAYNQVGSSNDITKDYWILELISGTYVLTLTDGTKIYYGHFAGYTEGLQYAEYYATTIKDTNGNTITINYYEPDDDFDRLEYYGAISSVTDSGGRITYFYLTSSTVGNRYRLSQIRRPDNERINYAYAYTGASTNRALLTSVTPPEGNPWTYEYNTGTSMHDLTKVTTSYGGITTYTFGTSELYYSIGYYKGFRTVQQKKSSGSNISSGTWNFQYFQSTDSEYTIISDPCGRTIKYRHYGYDSGLGDGNMWKVGLLISKEIVGYETTTYGWTRSSYISYDDYVVAVWRDDYIYVPYMSSQTISRDAQTYTTTYSSHDSYGNPGRISETGDRTRTTDIAYWYNTSKNIVKGNPSTETVSGSFSSTFTTGYTYDASTGNLTSLDRYGVNTTYTYYSNGNLNTKRDANSKTTTYYWDNGRVYRIVTPEHTINKSINTIGTIAWQDDGRGNRTYYTYDGKLRLTTINPKSAFKKDMSVELSLSRHFMN